MRVVGDDLGQVTFETRKSIGHAARRKELELVDL